MKNIIKNTSKGFTLIELVMVTIILGISSKAIPRYQETVDNLEHAEEVICGYDMGRIRRTRI